MTKERWVIQFLPIMGQGGFAGVFFSEKRAIDIYKSAVRKHGSVKINQMVCSFSFQDDNKTRYTLNLLNFVFLFGNMEEMIAAAVEHQKAEEAAQQELGAKSPVGIQGMKGYEIVKD